MMRSEDRGLRTDIAVLKAPIILETKIAAMIVEEKSFSCTELLYIEDDA